MARRYLGVEHGHQAQPAHRQIRDALRSIAKRRGISAWRLIGLNLRQENMRTDSAAPTLNNFIESRDLDDWSEAEILAFYQELYPPKPQFLRRSQVAARLRHKLIGVLAELEQAVVEKPSLSDAISGWFDSRTATTLLRIDLVTLYDLRQQINRGGQWWRQLPGVGKVKAKRIAEHLKMLLPDDQSMARPTLALPVQSPRAAHTLKLPASLLERATVSATAEFGRESFTGDQEGVQAWVAAKSGSQATALAYQREARRLLLWLHFDNEGKTFKQMSPSDCRSYMTFLQHVPDRWISRTHSQPGAPGWAPFRAGLSTASVKHAITVVVSLFGWLMATGHLQVNPWLLVNQNIADDASAKMIQSKALSEVATAQVLNYCMRDNSPAARRMLFIVQFVSSVGLRSAELLRAKLSDFQLEAEGWIMQVHGKGSKNRIVTVPTTAMAALNSYLHGRGLGDMTVAPPGAPVLASLVDAGALLGYQALYEHVKVWLANAIQASELPSAERARLLNASTHWLRHTFGTRAVARDVPLDVIQAQMGHASIQTTTSIYGRAPIRRRIDELERAFS